MASEPDATARRARLEANEGEAKPDDWAVRLVVPRPTVVGSEDRNERRYEVQRSVSVGVTRALVKPSVVVRVGRLLHRVAILDPVPAVDPAVVVAVLGAADRAPVAKHEDDRIGVTIVVGVLASTLAALAMKVGRWRGPCHVVVVGTVRALVEAHVACAHEGAAEHGSKNGQ